MNAVRIALVAAAVLGLVQRADAFGTVRLMGQNAEHERITRRALACAQASAPANCFQPLTMDMLAGKKGAFGAVGQPDDPSRGMLLDSNWHCDDGDYLDTPGYPQTQAIAKQNLTFCLLTMVSSLDGVVQGSIAILNDKGEIDGSQLPTRGRCAFGALKAPAKCSALENFGLLLHAVQDIYAHSNWTDQAATGATSLQNVPGLGNTAPMPWLNLTKVSDPPAGLITGCFMFGIPPDFSGQRGCAGRATHYYLNKDKGLIDPTIGAGTTPRGMINNNFANAVNVAILDTQAKWALVQQRIIATVGESRGKRAICALTDDNPKADC